MQHYQFDDIEALRQLVSEEFGDWGPTLTVTQSMIDQFAELTGDHYWIHTDPDKCRQSSPFKTTIAHGFLTLVLIPSLAPKPDYEVVGYTNILHYGADRLRFTGVVPVNSELRCRGRVREVSATERGATRVVQELQVFVGGPERSGPGGHEEQRPCLIYDMIYQYK